MSNIKKIGALKVVAAHRPEGKGVPRRRIKKHESKDRNDCGKKVQTAMKNLKARDIPNFRGIALFKEDGSLLQFSGAHVQISVAHNIVCVYGKPKDKSFDEYMPELMKELSLYKEQLTKQESNVKGSSSHYLDATDAEGAFEKDK